MKMKRKLLKISSAMMIIAAILLLLLPEMAEARRGGRSFGGRRSFSRRSSRPRAARPRSTRSRTTRKRSVPKTKQSSFGGRRMQSSKQYTSKYGTPRKSIPYKGTNAAGQPQRYIMHSYGGYGSGLMTGYMMGRTSWMWAMPFHPAFYYSRPYYASNPDGTMSVYPPTFSFQKLFFTLLIAALIIWLLVRWIKSKKQRNRSSDSYSSFG